MNATLPLTDGRVDVDGSGLRSQPHRGQHGAHLLHLGKCNLVVSRPLTHTVLDLGARILGQSSVNGVSGLLAFIDRWLEVFSGT